MESYYSTETLQHFMLVFFRITGLMFMAPVFGSAQMPPPVKVWLSFVVALIIFPIIDRTGAAIAPNTGLYAYAVLVELGLGILIGFAASLVFSAAQMGGMLIDQEMGLSMANVIDPITNQNLSVIGQFKLLMAVMVYLMIDGHHFLIDAIKRSFDSVPLMGMALAPAAALHLSDTMARDLFEVSVKIAGPALVTLFLVGVGLAFMARAMPEMNIFVVGFTLRIVIGLVVLALGAVIFQLVLQQALGTNESRIIDLLPLLKGGP